MTAHTSVSFLPPALKIARAICSEAIWHEDRCNWLGASNEQVMGAPRDFSRAMGASFYDGLAGLGYFLCSVLKAEKDAVIEETARGALNQLTRFVKEPVTNDEAGWMGMMGFHTGYPGQAWTLMYAAEILGEKKYAQAAKKALDYTLAVPREHWRYDVIDGAAGTIPVLIKLYKLTGDQRLFNHALQLGTFLIDKADKQSYGWSWDTMPGTQHNLTGYAHGTAGMAHAFAELFAATADSVYANAIAATVAYEEHHYHAVQQNWPDFRSFHETGNEAPTETPCSCAWCHGAPGIGLSRLRCYEVSGDQRYLPGARIAIDTTLKNNRPGPGNNYSLCHGLLGNAELFLYASQILNEPALFKSAEQTAMECMQKHLSTGLAIPNGLHSASHTPDFMLGTAGMGYFFLRLHAPQLFENMLLVRG
jgi:lantibiotic biosynthesis protein